MDIFYYQSGQREVEMALSVMLKMNSREDILQSKFWCHNVSQSLAMFNNTQLEIFFISKPFRMAFAKSLSRGYFVLDGFLNEYPILNYFRNDDFGKLSRVKGQREWPKQL